MKRITKQETLPALAVPEVLSVPELAYPARLGKRAVVQVLRKADVKKAALAVGGTALVLSAIGAAGKRQFYKRIVASELKRQLAVVNGKLDNLQAQNEALRAELARLSAAAAIHVENTLLARPQQPDRFLQIHLCLPFGCRLPDKLCGLFPVYVIAAHLRDNGEGLAFLITGHIGICCCDNTAAADGI